MNESRHNPEMNTNPVHQPRGLFCLHRKNWGVSDERCVSGKEGTRTEQLCNFEMKQGKQQVQADVFHVVIIGNFEYFERCHYKTYE